MATKTIDQHLDRLAVVFEKLQGAGLKLKPKKCKLLLTRIQPFQILVRNKDDWIWEEKHQECFEAMKETLIKAPVLGLPQEEGLFILDTDA